MMGPSSRTDELRRLATRAETPDRIPLVDKVRENALFDKLSALVEPAFSEVAFKLGVPRRYLEPAGAPLATRAITLIEWTKQQDKLLELERLVAETEMSRTVEIHRLEAHEGGTGLVVRLHGRSSPRYSTVPSTEGEPRFTGREQELGAIGELFNHGQVVVLHGAPGIGKSRLAREYAQKYRQSYPGGRFLVPFAQLPPAELAKLMRAPRSSASVGESLDEQCRRALLELGSEGRVLIIYDAVADERTLRGWLPYDGLEWHVLVTSTSASWAAAWNTVKVGALAEHAVRTLVSKILADQAAATRLAPALSEKAAGITMELCASATAAYEQLRQGRLVEQVPAELGRETVASFEAAWSLLSLNAQIVLGIVCAHEASRIPMELIVSPLERIGWSRSAVDAAIDEARDRSLIAGDAAWIDINALVARFARGREPLAELSIPGLARQKSTASAPSDFRSSMSADLAPAMTTQNSMCHDLVDLADGELEPQRAAAFRDHLPTCDVCQTGLIHVLRLDARRSILEPVENAEAGAAPLLGASEDGSPRSRPRTAAATARRRRGAASASVLAAVAMATLLLLWPHGLDVHIPPRLAAPTTAFSAVTTRPYEIRLAYADAAGYRSPRDVALGRGTAITPTDQVPYAVMGELEMRGDRHGLAIAAAWNGQKLADVLRQLSVLAPTPAVRSDRAALELLTTNNDNVEPVLAELEALRSSDGAS